jgi:ribosomal protein S27AE
MKEHRPILRYARLRCPRCGLSNWKTTGSPRKAGKIRQYRTCLSCGQKVITIQE